jgi:hypothetical protein
MMQFSWQQSLVHWDLLEYPGLLDLLQEGPCTAMIHHQVEVVHYFHHV